MFDSLFKIWQFHCFNIYFQILFVSYCKSHYEDNYIGKACNFNCKTKTPCPSILEDMCSKNTYQNCIEWETGIFKQKPNKKFQSSTYCNNYSNGIFSKGKWMIQQCIIPWLSSTEIRAKLTNTIYTAINFIVIV